MKDSDLAYKMAKDAAEIDFDHAIRGLLDGHRSAIEHMRSKNSQMSIALTASMCLVKESRITKETRQAFNKIICDAIEIPRSDLEREFFDDT